jgi:tetraacyldisaccharide 4'-kinase
MILKLVLSPLSLAYGILTTLRQFIFLTFPSLRFQSKLPVICLGNISAGGTGKTPLGLHLVALLKEDFKIGVLLRGYKSTSTEERPLLLKSSHSAFEVGDEALLYKFKFNNDIEVVISPNRKEGIKLLESLGVNLILMDDGLQHLKVKPSLAICVIEVSDLKEINNPTILSLLPSGRLREWPCQTLSKSDLVVFTKKSKLLEADKDAINKCISKYKIEKSVKVEFIADTLYDALSKEEVKPTKDASASLLTTIARPTLLIESLTNLNLKIKDKVILPDHTPISKEDWTKIQTKLPSPIICTEKDLIKIKDFIGKAGDVLVLKQDVRTDNLKELILSFLN